jgi:hypothetical protein
MPLEANLRFDKSFVPVALSLPVTCVCVRKELPLPSDLRVIDIVPGYYKKLARSRKLLAREHKSTLLLRSDDDSFGGMDSDAKLCLVHSLRSLGVPVVAPIAGPLWALGDGNSMLQSFGKRLQHVASSLQHCGHYVLWSPRTTGCGHFTGMVITPTSVVMHDGDTTNVFRGAADVFLPTDTVMYELVSTASTSVSVLEDCQLFTIATNREIASWA